MGTEKLKKELAENLFLLAGTELAMNFYGLYESWYTQEKEYFDDPDRTPIKDIPDGEDVFNQVKEALLKIFSKDFAGEESFLDDLYNLRDKLKKNTLSISQYSDIFRLYEYVLNRIDDGEAGATVDVNNDTAARDILTRIFASEDNALVNESIKLAVGQLPLRMTKGRFFDILKNTLEKYIGLDKASLDRLVYMIETASGIYDIPVAFDVLEDAAALLEPVNSGKLDKDQLTKARADLKNIVILLSDSLDLYSGMAELVNLACVYTLNYADADEEVCDLVLELTPVVQEALKGMEAGALEGSLEMSDEVYNAFTKIEGRIEPLVEKAERLEAKLESVYGTEDEEVKRFGRCKLLLSDSYFVDIDEEIDDSIVSAMLCQQTYMDLEVKLNDAFAGAGRLMNRARMAAVLQQLPVFFDSRTSVMNYVRESLDGCRDNFEKLASINLVLEALR